jgi:hypothetical protein
MTTIQVVDIRPTLSVAGNGFQSNARSCQEFDHVAVEMRTDRRRYRSGFAGETSSAKSTRATPAVGCKSFPSNRANPQVRPGKDVQPFSRQPNKAKLAQGFAVARFQRKSQFQPLASITTCPPRGIRCNRQ